MLKNYFWTLPFISFLLGYEVVSFFFSEKTVNAPAVIGLDLKDAFKLISKYNLNLRLSDEKEDKDLPDGVILNQIPRPNQKIKTNQSLFLVISKKPPKQSAPNLLNKHNTEIIDILKQLGVSNKVYYIESPYPKNICLAQIPSPNKKLKNNKMITYLSSGNDNLVLLPDFTDKSAESALKFLKDFHVNYKIFNQYEVGLDYRNYIISMQKPLAGSYINLKSPPVIQLQLKPVEYNQPLHS